MILIFALLYVAHIVAIVLSSESVSSGPKKRETSIVQPKHGGSPAVFTESSALFFLQLLKYKQKLQNQQLEKISTTPPTADCICVLYYLCDINQTIIADGIGTIDIRYRRCTGDLEVCCYLPTTKPPTKPPTTPTTKPPTTPTTKPPTTPTTKPPTKPTTLPPIIFPTSPIPLPTLYPECVCVQPWQCEAGGTIGYNGEGVINPRQQTSLCPIFGQVCCRLSSLLTYPTNPSTFPPIIYPPGQQQICFLCGSVIQCTNGFIIPAGIGTVNNGITYRNQPACPAPTGCCQWDMSSINMNIISTLLGPFKNAGTPQACYCVKSWACSAGNAVSLDGTGAIDPRFVACESADQVCCRPAGINTAALQESIDRGSYIVNDIPAEPAPQIGCGVQNKTFMPAPPYSPDSGKTYFAEFPWMVALLTEQPNGQYLFHCGGSLISTRAVLTAAHCVANRENEKFTARVGQWDLESINQPYPFDEVDVKTVITHPMFYSSALFHDIAVLILEEPVSVFINIRPICLPDQGANVLAGTKCSGSGWGRNSFGADGKYQTELRKIDVPIIDRSDCQARLRTTRLGEYFRLHGSFICAGGETNKDTCRGDGGGPLVCATTTGQFVQVGVVSWGIGCGTTNVPAVYTSVSQHRQWIDQQLATYGA